MKSKSIYVPLGFVLAFTAGVAAAQSLGDVARAQKEKQNKEEKKPAKVYNNEDLSEGKTEPGQTTDGRSSSKASDSASSSKSSGRTIAAESEAGGSVRLAPDERTDLIFMATWCPHSNALKNMLNDSRMRPYWANRKLIFLYSNNEWSELKPQLREMAKKGEISEDDIPAKIEELKRKSGSPVMHPTALDNLPGDHYFCSIPSEVDGFPAALSVQGYNDRYIWISQVLKVPNELSNILSDQYEPAKHKPADQ